MTNLFKFNYLYLAVWLFLIHSAITHAADLTFTPATPVVTINQTITLSVAGAIGQVRWQPIDGKIQGEGTQVTYLAPDTVGKDTILVVDSEDNTGILKVVITPPNDFSLENAQWEVFTNRSWITALLLSEDGKTLWVGTDGGLEKREAQTGEIQQVFINTDGLPDNYVTAIANDGQGGLWVGTYNGLAHYAQGQWQVFNMNNSGLPYDWVSTLLSDSQGGLWVGTVGTRDGGLAHYAQGQWQVFNTDNSGLPDNWVTALLSDSQGGLWVGTEGGGLAHYTSQGQWEVFNSDNSGLSSNEIGALLSDSQGGLWVEIFSVFGGLAHYTAQGQWQVFQTDNSGLPFNLVSALLSDSQGGLWVGTWEGGLAHYTAQGLWEGEVFNTDNSGLPDNWVTALLSDSQGGLWVGTGNGGLAHYTAQGQWQVFQTDNSGLPDNSVNALLSDNQGGLWMGTLEGGLAHYTASGQWQGFQTDNSGLPNNLVSALLSDSQGGLWVGTLEGGLAHYTTQGQWEVFNTDNSDLPDNDVTALLFDSQGGLWVGTLFGGLAHYTTQGQWEVFNSDNSGLLDNEDDYALITNNPALVVKENIVIGALLSDSQGGLWVGTLEGGLAHYTAQGQWQVFKTDNSSLPGNSVNALLSDSQGGLWVGTDGGLAHYTAQEQWQVFNTDNSGLPDNYVNALSSDSQGGLWVGTDGGLAHYTAQGQWEVFDTDNSSLPNNQVLALSSDSQGGLWVGTTGLAHLTFGRQAELCTQAQIDAATCQAIQQGQHAAIIVAAGGAQETNTLWESTEAITTRLYRTFYRRGFDKSHLYYLSPKTWADFDGDGFNDRINRISEDRELTLDDLQKAFIWAKGLGKLDQPLYFFFMDHGGEGKLQLSPDLNLTAEELKTMLDDYQTATGNAMVVVIEACHSGSLIPILTAPNRAVITSAKDSEKAYFFEKEGFSRFLADYLLRGGSFYESFTLASREQDELRGNFNLQIAGENTGMTSQTPQLDDNQDGTFTTTDGDWLKKVYVNGKFATADMTLTVENLTNATAVPVGQPTTLQAKVTLAQGTVQRVWAVIRPPAMAQIIDTSGTPILAFPRLNLGTSPEAPDIWQATWNDAVYNGKYLITFYAEDNEKNIASSELDTVLTVTGGIDPPAQAQVQIHLEKDRYQRGEPFKATLTEELGWGYDLYAAVLFPDGQNFMTLKNTNELRPLNEAKPWYALRKPHSIVTLFDLTLPADLPTGQYCLFGILSPEQNDVFETMGKELWVMEKKCFEMF